ncbi:Ubiquinone/menaquinone biosynthesis C-methyltransferase UbiE [Cytospora mali]|uniref:Ubiquinone/menaquinone biosynthesis C-methyltransferase UbiE n=1 Tax=Cytospora mali TaxID=578113 RepID=A0A194VQS8_CYTMA|nr:Ubiquinone/menaquinone biosynthesis C-methyltransferase UbiE [Valsa mali]
MAFQPKQITKYQAEHLAELQGDVSEQAIKFTLNLIPAFADNDVVHDNACGSGVVTETIMTLPPPSVRIHATDINAQFMQGVAALVEKNKWPVTTAVMSAQELDFPDNKFTHSFTSFAFHCLGDHDAAAKQVYRTLKPGGTAIASIWIFMPHVDALQHAHWRTRGRDGPMPTLLPLEGFQEADLRKALEAGGFKAENITCSNKDCYLSIPDIKRWAQLAWSYLGTLPSGWSQNDEDKWSEVIDDIVEQLESGDGISKNEAGETVLKMVACVAAAQKQASGSRCHCAVPSVAYRLLLLEHITLVYLYSESSNQELLQMTRGFQT